VKKQSTWVVASTAGLVAVFALGASMYSEHRAKELGFIAEKSFATFVPAHAAVLGPAEGKVYLIEFFDPACETCAAMAPFVKELLHSHEGKVKLAARCLPLHEGSETMCQLLEAAKRQDVYWQALDVLFKSQGAWASHHDPHPELVWGFLGSAGLDVGALQRDMKDPAVAASVAQDIADARALGVTKTPGFFVNGKPLVHFGGRQLRELLAGEVAATYGPGR
jgi:protein-disulfide isomerase